MSLRKIIFLGILIHMSLPVLVVEGFHKFGFWATPLALMHLIAVIAHLDIIRIYRQAAAEKALYEVMDS